MADHIGTRIAYWRRRRNGMTQAALAGLAGVSQAYISQLEAGHKTVDRRSTLVALAAALQVNLSDLLTDPAESGQPYREPADMAVPAIRVALAEIEEGERVPAPVRGRDEMDAAMEQLSRHRSAADYPAMAAMLAAGMLTDAAAYGGVDLARVGYEASTCLKNLGYRDLALPATRVAMSGAAESGDAAWLGATRYFHTIALPLESPGLAARSAVRAVSDLQAAAADSRARQMLGQIHLTAALSSAVDNRADDAEAHLTEARREAASLGDPDDGTGFNLLCFGPTNVGLWEMTVASEVGDFGRVVELARGIEPRHLKIADRHFSYWLSYGRALVQSGKTDPQALAAFTRAERVAPTSFARSQIVKDAVTTMVYRARRRSIPDDLRIMARRAGVTAAV